jgi:DNA-binding IclR family transcriptional regulator
MAVVTGGSLNWLADAQGARGGLMYYPLHVSGTVPLYATASGKSWLATMDKQSAISVVLAQGFNVAISPGPEVATNAHDLMQMLRETEQRGYGTAINEAESGVSAVAAAVRTHADGPGVGTVSVAGPSVRMTPERIQALGPVVRVYADRLGEIWPLRHKPSIPRTRA